MRAARLALTVFPSALLALTAMAAAPSATPMSNGNVGPGALADSTPETLPSVLAAARAKRSPALVEFAAPWCYSCYYMEKHIYSTPAWIGVKAANATATLDADSPAGSAAMKRYGVKMLPTLLVLDADGSEVGRIAGEQTPAAFTPQLDKLLAASRHADTLGRLEDRVRRHMGPDASFVAPTHTILATYRARGDGAGAMAFLDSVPAERRGMLETRPEITGEIARIKLVETHADDPAACLAAAAPVLANTATGADCEAAYDLSHALDCAESERMPAAERAAAVAPGGALASGDAITSRLLAPGACADRRTLTTDRFRWLTLAGRDAEARAGLSAETARLEKTVGRQPTSDRNAADNLRVYYGLLDDKPKLESWLATLSKAYPEDYVYPYRLGRQLLADNRPAEALPWLEQASAKAYGANRLSVAEQRSKALMALGRPDEARATAEAVLAENGPWFPEAAAKLRITAGLAAGPAS